MNRMPSSSEYLRLALDVSHAAARVILDVYQSPDFEVSIKGDQSPLTRADRHSHEIIVDGLASSGLPVLSEEGGIPPYAERREWERYWLVDPLDGTKEFLRRNGEFTVNLALVEGSAPLLGVVCAPAAGWIYWGRTDGGPAFRARFHPEAQAAALWSSGVPLAASPAARDASLSVRVIASRSHSGPDTESFIGEIERMRGPAERVSCGSSLKICRVAEGGADLYPRLAPTMEWDTAAAQAVLEAAGGRLVMYDATRSALEYLNAGSAPFQRLTYNKENLLNPSFVAMR